MDKEREDILNDLIKYYDGDTNASAPKNEDLGHTQVIPKPKAPMFTPAPDDLGQTLVVKTAPKAAETPAIDATRRIDISNTNQPAQPVAQPINKEEKQPVEEEVFGFLDLSGKPIEPPVHNASQAVAAPTPEPRRRQQIQPEAPVETGRKRGGVWYSLKPLWVTLIFCLIAYGAFEFYRTNTGLIGTYKRNFNDNMHVIFNKFGWKWTDFDQLKIVGNSTTNNIHAGSDPVYTDINTYTERDNVREDTGTPYNYIGSNKTVIPFADADSSDFISVDNGVICAKSNYVCFIGADGKKSWEESTTISNPIAASCGNYIALASKGGRQISLYKKHKLQYTTNVPYNIRECKVSSKGDIVLATDRTAYKGAVLMINSKGETVFSWSSGVNYITGINVLDNRRIAVSLTNADNRITSYVMLFNINSTEPEGGAEFTDTLLYEVYANNTTLLINGDNSLAALDKSGNVKYDIRYDNAVITHTANDSILENRVLTYIDNYQPCIAAYDKSGDIIRSYQLDNTPDFIDIYGTMIAYNNGRTIIFGNIQDDNRLAYRAPREIKRLMLLNFGAYAVVYDDCIEIVGVY